jgi:hypothetical protein
MLQYLVAFWSHPKHWAYIEGKSTFWKWETVSQLKHQCQTWWHDYLNAYVLTEWTQERFPTCWHSYKTQIERVNIKSRSKTTDKLWEVQKHSNAVQAAETSIGCRTLQVINNRMLEAHILAGWIHTMLRSNCQFTHSHDAVSANNQCANN